MTPVETILLNFLRRNCFLLSDTKLFDDSTISFDIFCFQVVKQKISKDIVQLLKNSVCVSNLLAAERLKSRSLLGGTAFLFLLLG